MAKYSVTASVVGSKWIGVFEADSPEEAIDKAVNSNRAYCSVCHQCSSQISDPECDEFSADEVDPKTPVDEG